MAWDDSDITPAVLLQHMQAMRFELTQQIQNLDVKLTGQIQGLDKKLTEQMQKMDRNLTRQIDAIDHRLDDIEIAQLPKRVTVLEEAVGIAA